MEIEECPHVSAPGVQSTTWTKLFNKTQDTKKQTKNNKNTTTFEKREDISENHIREQLENKI